MPHHIGDVELEVAGIFSIHLNLSQVAERVRCNAELDFVAQAFRGALGDGTVELFLEGFAGGLHRNREVRRIHFAQHALAQLAQPEHDADRDAVLLPVVRVQLVAVEARVDDPRAPARAVAEEGACERAGEVGSFVDLVAVPKVNEWQGRRSVELEVNDFRPARPGC